MKKNNSKKISKKIQFISSLWISFPILFLFLSLLFFQIDSSGIAKIILGPSYWITSLITIWSGFAMRELLWYAWGLFLFSNFLIVYECAVVLAYFSNSPHKLLALFSTLAVQSLVGYLCWKEIRVPYYSPKIRWWESDPRYKLNLKAEIVRLDDTRKPTGEVLSVDIVDISRGGCFVKTNQKFELDTILDLKLKVFEEDLGCEGQVVWGTESTITHPKGIGVRFINLDKKTVQALKTVSVKLKKLSQTYTEMVREKNWEEYLEREKQFQSKRKKKS